MVFRTAGATATLLMCLAGANDPASAQYSAPQAYPPQTYPPVQGYTPRPMADAEENAPPLNAPVTQGPLPPVGLGPQANELAAGIRYGRGTPAYPRDTALPPSSGSQGYHPMQPPDAAGTPGYHGVPGAIPPGPAGSAEQDAIRQDAMRRPPPERRSSRPRTSRSACNGIDASRRPSHYGRVPTRGAAGGGLEEGIAAAVPSHDG